MSSIFEGRSISVVSDLSTKEQLYLYAQSKRLQNALQDNREHVLDEFRIRDDRLAIHLFFLSTSSRTKSSFENAAKFHKANVFDSDTSTSSISKKESLTDCMKMLACYSSKSIFIVRSSYEGTCRWLAQALADHSKNVNRKPPIVLNAGDGQYHPTIEYVDQFGFLEQLNWSTNSIHLALIGDLFHSRNIHSKVDGLKIFGEVNVDLIAPEPLQLPERILNQMKSNGFQVRVFYSLDEYMQQSDKAKLWYFTNMQIEQYGDQLKEIKQVLHASVTFKTEWIDKLNPSTKFFYPLPRSRDRSCVPEEVDSTFLCVNTESTNGFIVRTTLLSMLAGKIGADYNDFVEMVPLAPSLPPSRFKVSILPLQEGIVLDHICMNKSIDEVWKVIFKVRRVLQWNIESSQGVFPSTAKSHGSFKGVISIPNKKNVSTDEIKKVATLASGCTINFISNGKVEKKYRLKMPSEIHDYEKTRCLNSKCISQLKNNEAVVPSFVRIGETNFRCRYCERVHEYGDIWIN